MFRVCENYLTHSACELVGFNQFTSRIQFVRQILLDFTRKLQHKRQFVTCFFLGGKIVYRSGFQVFHQDHQLRSNSRDRKCALQETYDFLSLQRRSSRCLKPQLRFTSPANPLTLSNLTTLAHPCAVKGARLWLRKGTRGMRLWLMDRITAKQLG